MYVYANNDGLVANNVIGGSVMMRPGDVWFADDPFVRARPELFSATPTIVHSTSGRQSLPATPVGSRPAAATVVVDLKNAEIVPELADAIRAGRPRGRRA